MPKKNVAREGKVRTPPSTPDNCKGAKKYRKFSPATAKIRDSVIDSTANDAIEAKRENLGKDGKPRLPTKWMKNVLEKINKRFELLKITKDDIMNRIRKKEEEMKTNEEAEAKEKAKKQTSKNEATRRSSSSHEATRSAVEVSIDNDVSPSDTNVSSLS